MNARSILLFENSIKAEATRKVYTYCLKRFVKYYKLRDTSVIVEIPDKKLQEMCEDYLFYLKPRVKPSMIKSTFQALELLCVVNDKLGVNFKKIHKMYPKNENTSGKIPWTTKEVQKMLESITNPMFKAVIHLLASTGCRIGAIPSLKLSNISEISGDCMAIQFYEGTNEEYTGFLTPEATKHLKEYLNKRQADGEVLDKNHPLFRKKYRIGIEKVQFHSANSLGMITQRVIERAGLRRDKDGQRYGIMKNHGFRKRFNTILKSNENINPAIAEKLMGHKVNLDGVYFKPTRDKCFSEFVKAIPELTIDDKERLRLQNKIKDARIKELESDKNRITNLESKLANVENLLKRIQETKDQTNS